MKYVFSPRSKPPTQKGGIFITKRKTITNQAIISALLSCSTLDEAAKMCGLSVRQLYERRQDTELITALKEAQSAALSGTVRYLQYHTGTAARTLVEIAQNGQQEQNRLNAARVLLEQAARLTELADFEARLSKLEQAQEETP